MRKAALCGLLASIFIACPLTGAWASGGKVYRSGAQTGASRTGVRIVVSGRRFSVVRISYPETCAGATPVIRDQFTFSAGKGAQFSGKVDSQGRFSGRFNAVLGHVMIKGQIAGRTIRIKSVEASSFTSSHGAKYSCHGNHTFNATRT